MLSTNCEARAMEEILFSLPERRSEWRRHRRIPASGVATISFPSSDGQLKILNAQLRDVSAGGVGIHLNEFVPKGQKLLLEMPQELSLRGTIRYCNRLEDGYRAGIEIERS